MSTNLGQIAQELARTNPWWRRQDWQDSDADLHTVRSASLNYRSGALSDLEPGNLYILRGPRRVGKTVAVKQAIEDLMDQGVPGTCIVRVAADGWDAKDIRNLPRIPGLPPIPAGQTRYWFVDEISAVKGEWAEEIKWLRDNDLDFQSSTVVLTGSNARSLSEAIGALAGRRGRGMGRDKNRTLLPMGFSTFVKLVGDPSIPVGIQIPLADLRSITATNAYQTLIPWLDDLVRLWEMYILYGGFPRSVVAAAVGAAIPSDFVDDLFDVVSADAFKASNLGMSAEMALLERLWESMGTPANLSNVARTVGTSRPTVVRHVEYLRDSFLLWQCPQKDARGWVPFPGSRDKIYAIDPLIARMAHLRNPARQDIDPTILTEMQLGLAIIRRVTKNQGVPVDDLLFYYRTPTANEIDFVSDLLMGTAVEGKYCEGTGWKRAARTVNSSSWKGLMITRNYLDTSSADAWAVPACLLTLVLDS